MSLFKKILIFARQWRYPGSAVYWENRYAKGGNSGTGSQGILAAYKAEIVNTFVREQGIHSLLEFGCGDGQQLQLAQYPTYTGLDVAASAIARCRAAFAGDKDKNFVLYDPFRFNAADFQADLTLSMEVIFHLTEETNYQLYLQHLFACARQWVVIFSSNTADNTGGRFPHFKPRRFTDDIPPGWTLRHHLPNPHTNRSISEFFFFEKTISL